VCCHMFGQKQLVCCNRSCMTCTTRWLHISSHEGQQGTVTQHIINRSQPHYTARAVVLCIQNHVSQARSLLPGSSTGWSIAAADVGPLLSAALRLEPEQATEPLTGSKPDTAAAGYVSGGWALLWRYKTCRLLRARRNA
jgi:hypothetical protein